MQFAGIEEVNKTTKPNLNELDTALKELGMLATSTNSREEYMKEISTNPCSSSLKINTKYISNVIISSGKYKSKTHNRFNPYTTRERNRTKSENNDCESFSSVNKISNDCLSSAESFHELKKAKSLESIVSENKEQVDFGKIQFDNLPELETVSECIQNLNVGD